MAADAVVGVEVGLGPVAVGVVERLAVEGLQDLRRDAREDDVGHEDDDGRRGDLDVFPGDAGPELGAEGHDDRDARDEAWAAQGGRTVEALSISSLW